MVRSCNCRCACSCSACSFASRFSSFSLSERLAASNCALRSSSSLAFASAALRRSRKLAASERSFFASAKDIVSCPSPAWGSGGVVSPAWGGGALPPDPAWGSAAVGSSSIIVQFFLSVVKATACQDVRGLPHRGILSVIRSQDHPALFLSAYAHLPGG